MSIFKLDDFDFSNKVVLVRVDLNVPIDKKGKVLDDKRIRAVLPTINYLIKKNARIVLMAHLGRPKGKIVEELRLTNVGKRLEKLLGFDITTLKDCIGSGAEKHIIKLSPGNIILLENLRFYEEEKNDDEEFAIKLADLGELYVNDAFGVCHRANASVHAITKFLPSCAGLLLQKEIKMLSQIIEKPKKPFIAILGGAKVSDKIGIIKSLLKKIDKLLIGGAMMFTFLKAQGLETGNSIVENDKLKIAKELLKNPKLILPVDTVVAKEPGKKVKTKNVLVQGIPKDMVGLDIGKDTIKYYQTIIKNAKTIFWNGPLGMFEIKKFAKGTNDLIKIIAKSKATSIIGGGETGAAVEKLKLSSKFTHVSTGGGASLEFVEGKKLPGIAALENNYKKFKDKV